MAIRIREMEKSHTTGLKKIIFLGSEQSSTTDNCKTSFSHCEDVADSPGLEHNFEVSHFDGSDLKGINGTCPSGSFAGTLYQEWYPPSFFTSCNTHVAMPNASIIAGDFATLLARTNPSRPVVTPLTLLQDVIELPRMLRDAGKLMRKGRKGLSAKDIANQNLAIQFGWMPLIQDVQHLLDLQSHVQKRTAEIHRLYQKQGLKRRITLGTGSGQSTVLVPNAASGGSGLWNAKFERIGHFKKWGTVRWKPTSLPPYLSDTERLNHQVQKIVGGLTPEGLLSGAWDVLPWTWLVDWFTNAGDFLLTHSNTVPAESGHASVMLNTVTKSYCSHYGNTSSWLTGGDGTSILENKRRNVGTGLTLARVPFIGLRRLSILGSLFIQRFK
jgi:hypothetical protein